MAKLTDLQMDLDALLRKHNVSHRDLNLSELCRGGMYMPGGDGAVEGCMQNIPTTYQLYQNIHMHAQWAYAIVVGLCLCSILTFLLYVDLIRFVMRTFKHPGRAAATLWVTAVIPVYSFCALLGCLVPRSGTLVDLVSSVYFATVVYQFLTLMVNYFGGEERMIAYFNKKGSKVIVYRTPPICCCCFCCPRHEFTRKRYVRIKCIVLQVCVIRPILMFLASAMWANGTYIPGEFQTDSSHVYFTIINLATTMTAIYGLYLLKEAFSVALDKFVVSGKMLVIQLVLLTSVFVNIIISGLVTGGVIQCTAVLPSKARGETIYHSILVCFMFLYALLARKFYQRKEDCLDTVDIGEGSDTTQTIINVPLDDVTIVQPMSAYGNGQEPMKYFHNMADNTQNSSMSEVSQTMLPRVNYNNIDNNNMNINNSNIHGNQEPYEDNDGWVSSRNPTRKRAASTEKVPRFSVNGPRVVMPHKGGRYQVAIQIPEQQKSKYLTKVTYI